MKKLIDYILILFGILSLIGIYLIAQYSNHLSSFIKNIGFIFLGYIGVITFTIGWMNLHRKKKNK